LGMQIYKIFLNQMISFSASVGSAGGSFFAS
jgi:hypothetical protein